VEEKKGPGVKAEAPLVREEEMNGGNSRSLGVKNDHALELSDPTEGKVKERKNS